MRKSSPKPKKISSPPTGKQAGVGDVLLGGLAITVLGVALYGMFVFVRGSGMRQPTGGTQPLPLPDAALYAPPDENNQASALRLSYREDLRDLLTTFSDFWKLYKRRDNLDEDAYRAYTDLVRTTRDALGELRVPTEEKERHLAIVLQFLRLDRAISGKERDVRFSAEDGLQNLLLLP